MRIDKEFPERVINLNVQQIKPLKKVQNLTVFINFPDSRFWFQNKKNLRDRSLHIYSLDLVTTSNITFLSEPTIHLLILIVLTSLYTDNGNSAPNLNIFIIISPFGSLEHALSSRIINDKSVFLHGKSYILRVFRG